MRQFNPLYRRSGKSVFVILAIIGFIVFFGIAALIGGGVYLVNKVRSDSDTLKTVRGTEQGCACSLQVPSNWTDLPAGDRNLDATIQQANLFGERYVMVISDKKSEVEEIFGWQGASDEEMLQKFTDLTLGAVEETFDVRRISNRKLKVNGRPAIQHKFRASVDGIEVVFWTTYIDGSLHLYQVQAWTIASMEAQNEAGLLEVADSFKEN